MAVIFHRMQRGMICLLLGSLVLNSDDSLALLSDAGSATLTGSLVLDTASLHLVREDLGTGLLSLGLVNVLHENTLVLEDVTLRFLVQDVVKVLVDLASLPVLPEQSPQHTLPPHPLHLGGHACLCATLSLTGAGVATLALGGEEIACAGAGVDGGRLDDNAAVLDELLHMGAGVRVTNLGLLSGVEPDFSFANAGDAGGEALL